MQIDIELSIPNLLALLAKEGIQKKTFISLQL